MLDYELPIPRDPSHHVLDASKLNCFMECQRKFFYSYLLAWRSENPSNHLIFGSAWHEALEHLLINGFEQEQIYQAFLKFESKYRETFSDPELDEVFFPKTPERAFEALVAYSLEHSNDFKRFKVLFTEVAFTVRMDENRSLSGRMDSILEDRNNGLISSLEHKTASSANRWGEQWPLAMQGGLYTHALMCLYGFDRVSEVIFNGTVFKKTSGARGGAKFEFVREPVKRSKASMQTWYLNTLYWMDAIEREYELLANSSSANDVMVAFPMNTTSCSKYFGCQFKDFCLAWKNPLRHCSQPPIGMIAEFWNPLTEPANVTMSLELGSAPTIVSKQ